MDPVEKKYQDYFVLTRRALDKVKIFPKDSIDLAEAARDFLDLAQRYFSDAQHFKEKGDVLTALLAVTYAHAWLDAGARLGLFNVGGDSELFMVDDE